MTPRNSAIAIRVILVIKSIRGIVHLPGPNQHLPDAVPRPFAFIYLRAAAGAYMKTAFLLGAFVLLAAPLAGRESTDLVVLKNGDRITGEIKGLQGGVLKIDLSYVDGTLS